MAISFRNISIGMLSSMILLSVKLSKRLDRVIYEPEQFPALIYETRDKRQEKDQHALFMLHVRL